PHRTLLKEYTKIQQLAAGIQEELKALRKIQKEMVEENLFFNVALFRRAGGISLKKTEFIEEFSRKLTHLAKHSQQRMEVIGIQLEQTEPLSPLEKDELSRIISFLEEVQVKLPNLQDIYAIHSSKDRLIKIENALRDITKLAEKFHEIERFERSIARSIIDHEISPLLRKIYEEPQILNFRRDGKQESLLAYRITKGQLRKLEDIAVKINACQDPHYKIAWRHWWSKEQRPESDPTIPIGAHVNVTIKLFGKAKKDLHLLVA
ncbi:TPA: hypothetical protein HA234_00535, partial [Candidatus Woesearchaeota archaeon]|nr:hypothetical protein [Candidatus Woesearchaeota archaeon]